MSEDEGNGNGNGHVVGMAHGGCLGLDLKCRIFMINIRHKVARPGGSTRILKDMHVGTGTKTNETNR